MSQVEKKKESTKTQAQKDAEFIGSLDEIHKIIITGNLISLTLKQRIKYYIDLCKELKLDPVSRPFEYILFNRNNENILVLYATKSCAEQLRARENISINIIETGVHDNMAVVRARATAPNGRTDEAIACVDLSGMTQKERANAIMKADTKAKRRVTLSICSLGMMADVEAADVPGAKTMSVEEGAKFTIESKEKEKHLGDRKAKDEYYGFQKSFDIEQWTQIEDLFEQLSVSYKDRSIIIVQEKRNYESIIERLTKSLELKKNKKESKK